MSRARYTPRARACIYVRVCVCVCIGHDSKLFHGSVRQSVKWFIHRLVKFGTGQILARVPWKIEMTILFFFPPLTSPLLPRWMKWGCESVKRLNLSLPDTYIYILFRETLFLKRWCVPYPKYRIKFPCRKVSLFLFIRGGTISTYLYPINCRFELSISKKKLGDGGGSRYSMKKKAKIFLPRSTIFNLARVVQTTTPSRVYFLRLFKGVKIYNAAARTLFHRHVQIRHYV